MGSVLTDICKDEAWEELTVKVFKEGKKRLRNGGFKTVRVRTLAGNVVELETKYLAPMKAKGARKRNDRNAVPMDRGYILCSLPRASLTGVSLPCCLRWHGRP